MTSTSTSYPPVLVRAEQAELLSSIGHTLLADSPATRGALSSHRVSLGPGGAGAVPHRHTHSSELFYIIDGALDVLLGNDVVTARHGDLLVVPPGVAHAFGAHRDAGADALIVITPGIERFDYFRHVAQVRQGAEPRDVLLGLQDTFDTHFLDSLTWNATRAAIGTDDGPTAHRQSARKDQR
jgi:quercetin dioxygenase-like cupin family protein